MSLSAWVVTSSSVVLVGLLGFMTFCLVQVIRITIDMKRDHIRYRNDPGYRLYFLSRMTDRERGHVTVRRGPARNPREVLTAPKPSESLRRLAR